MPPSRRQKSTTNETKIPRPPNPFMLFRNEQWELQKEEGKVSQSQLSRVLGKQWKSLSALEQKPYQEKAKIKKAEHAAMYPDYKYKPKSRAQKEREKAEAKSQKYAETTENSKKGKRRGGGSNKRGEEADVILAFPLPQDRFFVHGGPSLAPPSHLAGGGTPTGQGIHPPHFVAPSYKRQIPFVPKPVSKPSSVVPAVAQVAYSSPVYSSQVPAQQATGSHMTHFGPSHFAPGAGEWGSSYNSAKGSSSSGYGEGSPSQSSVSPYSQPASPWGSPPCNPQATHHVPQAMQAPLTAAAKPAVMPSSADLDTSSSNSSWPGDASVFDPSPHGDTILPVLGSLFKDATDAQLRHVLRSLDATDVDEASTNHHYFQDSRVDLSMFDIFKPAYDPDSPHMEASGLVSALPGHRADPSGFTHAETTDFNFEHDPFPPTDAFPGYY